MDDLAESKRGLDELQQIAREADEVFGSIGLTCKGWTVSGLDPPDAVSKTGLSVGVFGQKWYPRLDAVEIQVPQLHFGPKRRGKVDEKIPRFKGTN